MNLDVKVKELAEILMVTPRRIQQLGAEKIIQKKERGVYPLMESVQNYIRYISLNSKDAEGMISHDELNISLKKERLRLLKAQADKEEISAMLDQKKALLSDDVLSMLIEVFNEIKTKLLIMPDRCEPYLKEADTVKLKEIITAEVKESLHAISDGVSETIDRFFEDEKNGSDKNI
ncbi:hypothetical protein L3V83_15390 [Thiotrichales bacterium 19X7-9]|nr:hypothetical protein [Thiotrichales bacterium 19X7-9]